MTDTALEGITPLNLTPEKTEAELDAQIPKPVGYHILVAMPQVETTFGGSDIIKSAKTVHHESILSMVGLVLDMGDQAYSDKERFPTGPWCKIGDFVMFRMNSGTRFKVDGQEYRLLNDDSIEAIVDDPNAISNV
jgi:co-chaperonin GroES (HSP10)